MITLFFQSIVGVLMVLFAWILIRIVRLLPHDGGTHAAGWHIAAVVFAVFAINKLVNVVWAAWAFFAGPGSGVYRTYLHVVPIANHSRTFLMFGLYAALVALAFRPQYGRVERRTLYVVIALALTTGAAIGWAEGSIVQAIHYSRTAVLDTFGFVALACVLFLLMVRDAVDRYLWSALALFGFTSVFSVLFLTAMAWIGSTSVWTPPNWTIQASTAILVTGLIALAYQRLRLAQRGVKVAGLMPATEPRRPTLA